MLDDREYEGETYTEVVSAMADDKLTTANGNDRYREVTAERIKELYDIEVPHDSDESFIKGLVRAGIMEQVFTITRTPE